MATTSMATTAWGDLPVKLTTDKIPPGWYVGCNWEFKKYKAQCDEWRALTEENMSDRQCAVALRLRLRGTAYDSAMAAPRPTLQADGSDPTDHEYWTKHWEHMDRNYLEDLQNWNMALFDQFFEFSPKNGVNVRDAMAEPTLRYAEMHNAGRRFENVAKSYWSMKSGRFAEGQDR